MQRTLIALVCGTILLAAVPAFAQTGLGGALQIASAPANPTPNSTVTLTADSPLFDLTRSDIEWTVNGAPAGAGKSIKITLGGIGTQTIVGLTVSGQTGNDSAQRTLAPTSIDLLWEADSYIPPFYKGRAAPTSGSSIHVLAVPHFVRADGTTVLPSEIDFTWKVNGAVDETQSGIGESSVRFPASILYGSDLIVVDAQTPDGSLSGEASVSIQTLDPQLVLYEDSPLFGVMYYQALGASQNAAEAETSFAAVPYFAAATSPNDPSLAYAWNVNGNPVAADPRDPSEITLSASSSQQADLTLTLSKPSDPFFSTSGAWSFDFNRSGAGTTGSASLFHASQ